MRTMTVCGKSLKDGERKELVYSILIDEVRYEGCTVCEVYGAGIRNRSTGETETVRNITSDFDRALDIISLLARNLVTPVTLADVISDLAVC